MGTAMGADVWRRAGWRWTALYGAMAGVLFQPTTAAEKGGGDEAQLVVYDLYELHECTAPSTVIHNSNPPKNASSDKYFDHHIIEQIESESHLWMYNEDPFETHHWDFAQGPLSWAAVIFAAIVVRMLWREVPVVGEMTPESVVEIVVGFVAAIVFEYGYGNPDYLGFDSNEFFFYILPWIILEAGYSINNYYVVQHLWTILLHAVVGTILNVLVIGTIMWAVSSEVGVEDFRLDQGLLFGSFIAAVDPVAVLSVLTEFHVHPSINAIVGGESLLNDGVAVVVYRIMVAVTYSESYYKDDPTSETYEKVVGLALLQMFIVFIGGGIIGAGMGILSCYILKRFLDLCAKQDRKKVAKQKERQKIAKRKKSEAAHKMRVNFFRAQQSMVESRGIHGPTPATEESGIFDSHPGLSPDFDRRRTVSTSSDESDGTSSRIKSPRKSQRRRMGTSAQDLYSKLAQLEEDGDEVDNFQDSSESESENAEGHDEHGLIELVPILVILLGYLAYLLAETFRFTGIVTIMVYGMVVNQYEHYCMTDTHIAHLKYILGVAGHTADSVVFLIIGQQFWVACSSAPVGWNAGFIMIAYIVTNSARTVGVVGLGWIDNIIRGKEHKKKIPMKDLALLSFGGLRGAIAFALVYTLADENYACVEITTTNHSSHTLEAVQIFPHKDLLLTTTVMLVILTVFIQGTLAGTVVQLLHTDREHAETTFDLTNNTLMDNLRKGFSAIAETKHRWRLGWWISRTMMRVEDALKNRNYHFLTRFHHHAKNKVKERQALAFQILKAHYFTAHDHAQEMVALAHKKNFPPDKIAMVKKNMQQYIQVHMLMAMRDQVANHSTFHKNIAKAMVDAHDQMSLDINVDVSDSAAKFKAFHRVIRKSVKRAEHFVPGSNRPDSSARKRAMGRNSVVEVTGFNVDDDGAVQWEGKPAVKDNSRDWLRQSIRHKHRGTVVAEPPRAFRRTSWTHNDIRRRMSHRFSDPTLLHPAQITLGAVERASGFSGNDPLSTQTSALRTHMASSGSDMAHVLSQLKEEDEEAPPLGHMLTMPKRGGDILLHDSPAEVAAAAAPVAVATATGTLRRDGFALVIDTPNGPVRSNVQESVV
mmetsp:Transcript_11914/g.30633  ORF Transcript_11914/g.30633 Transcript_11914/m.30633 type:complete len:1100 (+) Transcript_11914:113-3412(+)